jgi:hypothetical protein
VYFTGVKGSFAPVNIGGKMTNFLAIKIVHSQSHMFFPKIIITVLAILFVIMMVQRYFDRKKQNKPFINHDFKFFIKGFDKIKLFGTVILLVLYVGTMNITGFLLGSIIFISLFNILYAGSKEIKSIIASIGIASLESVIVWYVFGQLLAVTLP